MNNESLILDLPPAPPAYVEVVQDLSAPSSKEIVETLKQVTSRGDGHEPPRDHVEKPPPQPEPEPMPPGQSLGMEVPRSRWRRGFEPWLSHATRVHNINQSGMDNSMVVEPLPTPLGGP